MKNDSNKKKIIIASIIGVIILMVAIVGVVYSSNKPVNEEKVNIETNEIDIDSTISDVTNAAAGQTLENETASNIAISDVSVEEKEETIEASSEATSIISEESTTVETETVATETVETQAEANEPIVIETSTVTTSAYGTPQEYNGDPEGRGPGRIIVKGFDYNDVYQGMAWKGDYWTASNGVEIKVIPVEGNIYERLPVPDGKGLDNAPGSPFRVACNEAAGTASDKFNAVSETIPVTSFKRDSIDTSDANLLAFKNSYDSHYGGYSGGGAANASLNVFSDGVADVDNLGATFWSIRREGDYWKLQINGNLDAWRWSGVHQILRYLSPDGEALYNAIYDCFYTGGENYDVWDAYDTWETIGNSQCYLGSSSSGGIWYIK